MEQKATNNARNSPFRKITTPITEAVCRTALRFAPELTADDITRAGLWGILVGASLTLIPKETIGVDTRPFALALMSGASLLDAFDGAMARVRNTSSNDGAILDLLVDRWQESGLALARIASAGSRKNPWGVVAATASGITNPLPSYYRAKVEERGYCVPESGAKAISFLGTRPMRAVFGITATTYPNPTFIRTELPLQPVLDSVSALSNVFTAFERAKIYKKAQRGQLERNPDKNTQELGKLKEKNLRGFIAKNTAIMLAAGMIGLVACTN